MEVKYKNNIDKLVFLGLPGILLIIGLYFDSLFATILGLAMTIAISTIVGQFMYHYRKGNVVISIKKDQLIIRSNKRYIIDYSTITHLELKEYGKKKRQSILLVFKGKGLSKLSKKVRNKIGYMQGGGSTDPENNIVYT